MCVVCFLLKYTKLDRSQAWSDVGRSSRCCTLFADMFLKCSYSTRDIAMGSSNSRFPNFNIQTYTCIGTQRIQLAAGSWSDEYAPHGVSDLRELVSSHHHTTRYLILVGFSRSRLTDVDNEGGMGKFCLFTSSVCNAYTFVIAHDATD